MELCYFEDATPGYQSIARSLRVSAEDIVEFTSKWDPVPFSVSDPDQVEPFKAETLTASTAHVYAIFTRLMHKQERQMAVISTLGINDLHYLMPVQAGDELYLSGVCLTAKEADSRSDRGTCQFEWRLLNHKDQIVCTLKQKIILAKRINPIE